jgi:hypothetical protein
MVATLRQWLERHSPAGLPFGGGYASGVVPEVERDDSKVHASVADQALTAAILLCQWHWMFNSSLETHPKLCIDLPSAHAAV